MRRRIRLLLPLVISLFLLVPIGYGQEEEPPKPAHDEAKREPNRLIHESSPYLRQHAHNPVDWYPWGEEAFERARREDRPIFLSIGYSTCHWCHVMERESFESEAIAEILNAHYISIKVDREERPDVDAIYMSAVLAISGQGGWPLTVFLTPDGKPIWGATYLPPETRGQRIGLPQVLLEINNLWTNDRPKFLGSADAILEAVRTRAASAGQPVAIGADTLVTLRDQLAASFDDTHGGFGSAPKFPRPHEVIALLSDWSRTGHAPSLEMAEFTLDRMAAGGMRDHLGGGFHRYSTDERWLVPHFEKMLYDQALLARAYLFAYQATGHERHLDIATETLDYVLRDLTDAGGGFHSAEDADSEGAEGKFYVWTLQEIQAELTPQEAAVFVRRYAVEAEGNFKEAFHHEGGIPTGTNILHIAEGTDDADEALLASAREKLLEVRSKRVRPHLDDKVLTGWNGLFLSALALAYQVTGNETYRTAADRTADFLLDNLVRDGRLLRRYRAGKAGILGYLDDYAFLALGLLDLYEATFEIERLRQAQHLAAEMNRLFWDNADDGYFFTGSDGEELVARSKKIYDGAIPSGNSVAAVILGRLARMTGSVDLERRFARQLDAFSARAAHHPLSHPFLLEALGLQLGPSREVVLAGELGGDLDTMKRAIQTGYHPRLVLLHHPPGAAGEAIEAIAPFLDGVDSIEGRATAYVCENFACQEPTTEIETLLESLGR